MLEVVVKCMAQLFHLGVDVEGANGSRVTRIFHLNKLMHNCDAAVIIKL